MARWSSPVRGRLLPRSATGYHSRCLGRLNRSIVTFRPYAVAMKDDRPFGIGSLWENWNTTDANSLVADIQHRMLLILASGDHARWPGDKPDLAISRGRSRPSPCACGRRVNKPENDDTSIVEPVELATDVT
jgi:putative SOS response-associated peptidase YedK